MDNKHKSNTVKSLLYLNHLLGAGIDNKLKSDKIYIQVLYKNAIGQ